MDKDKISGTNSELITRKASKKKQESSGSSQSRESETKQEEEDEEQYRQIFSYNNEISSENKEGYGFSCVSVSPM